MPKYNVKLVGRASVWTDIDIEADNAEQAEAFALVKITTDAQQWNVEPQPVDEIEATEVDEEE